MPNYIKKNSNCDRPFIIPKYLIIQLLAAGMRDREIATKLFISDRTVKFHINNAVTKLKAKTRIQAVHQAYAQGLLTSLIEKISSGDSNT